MGCNVTLLAPVTLVQADCGSEAAAFNRETLEIKGHQAKSR